MVECGWGASRTKESFFKQKYQKLVVRKGSKKAIVAVGHKIIISVYHVLKNKEAYKSPLLNNEKFEQKRKEKEVQRSIVKLSSLGFTVRLTPVN